MRRVKLVPMTDELEIAYWNDRRLAAQVTAVCDGKCGHLSCADATVCELEPSHQGDHVGGDWAWPSDGPMHPRKRL